MLDKLKELVSQISEYTEDDAMQYKHAAKMRKILAGIQKECHVMRKKILDICKEHNEKIFNRKKK